MHSYIDWDIFREDPSPCRILQLAPALMVVCILEVRVDCSAYPCAPWELEFHRKYILLLPSRYLQVLSRLLNFASRLIGRTSQWQRTSHVRMSETVLEVLLLSQMCGRDFDMMPPSSECIVSMMAGNKSADTELVR